MSRNLESSVLFSLPFLGYQPANISNGQPALDAANIVKQTISGAPFKWPWNRTEFEGNANKGDQYTVLNIANFGFLEQAWITNLADGKVKELTVKKSLSAESAIQRPESVAAQIQDTTTVAFRFNTVLDQNYALGGYYQRAPTLMSSLASSWAPIPDALGYIYDWGFLSIISMITKDIRLPYFSQKFVSHLLGAQDGLTALERNIFIGDWLTILTEPGRAQMTGQQGVQARGQS
jgi:hypothetical protein